jgi:hypothetical protein
VVLKVGPIEYTLNPKFCLEADCLYHAILGSIETQKEVERSRANVLYFDVARFYQPEVLENLKMAQRIVEEIARPISSFKDSATFVDKLNAFVGDFGSVCDAFYSHRPFFVEVFKQTVIYFQEVFRSSVRAAWAHNKSFSAKQMLEITSAFRRWEGVMRGWSITDANFSYCERPLTESFFTTLFENSQVTLGNILGDFLTSYKVVEGIAVSPALDSLENHFLFVVDHYTNIPTLCCLEEALRYVGRVLNGIQLAIHNQFKKPLVVETKVLIALINSSFLKVAKTVTRKVAEIAKEHFDPKTAKLLLNERFISFLNVKLVATCKAKFAKNISEKIRLTFAAPKDMLDFNLTFTMRDLLAFCDSHIRLFAVPDNIPDFFHVVFTKIIKNYVLLFAASQPRMSSSNIAKYQAKVAVDLIDFEKLCVESLVENSEFVKRRFRFLLDFLQATDLDVILISLLNLELFCKKFHDPQQLRMLIKTKGYLPQDSEEFLMHHFGGPKKSVQAPVPTKAQIAKTRSKALIHVGLILLLYFKLSFFTRNFDGTHPSHAG